MSEGQQCKAIKPDGERCRGFASGGGDFCFFHDPARAKVRKEAQAFGGRRGRRRPGLPDGPATKEIPQLEHLRDPLKLADMVTIRRPDGSVGPPKLTEQQRRVLLKLTEPGIRTLAVIWGKRSGKTLLQSVALLAASFRPGAVSICLSNSRESAQSLAFSRVKDMLRRNRALSAHAKVTQHRIEFDWGSRIVTVPCSQAAVTGLTIEQGGILAVDELWASPDIQVYFLLASQAEQGKVFVTSQASGLESHVYSLWESFDKGEADGSLWCDYISYPSVEAAAENYPNPYITREFLEARQSELPANIFANYFLGVWGRPGSLFRPDVVEQVFSPDLHSVTRSQGHTYLVGLDLGLTHDRAARVVAHWQDEALVVDAIRLWEGADFPSGEVEISAVEDDLLAVNEAFRPVKIILDPYQLKSSRQRLDKVLPRKLEEYTFSSQSVARLSQQVFALVNDGRLHCYVHPEFRAELLGLVAQPRSYGWRLDHTASGYSDITISVGMAALFAADEAQKPVGQIAFTTRSSPFESPARQARRRGHRYDSAIRY